MRNMIEIAVREALEEEMTRHLGARPHERTPTRRGHRNGTKPRTMKTTVGDLRFDVPQARDGSFRPSVFERCQRSDRALVAAMQEMVVQGVSTRRVAAVLEEMAGFTVSAATVSRAMAELDEEIVAFRSRDLRGQGYPFLVIDARYEKVRRGGRVLSTAVLIAAGITDEGRREVLGCYLGDSESEATWGEVLIDLKRRGLGGVELVVSDAHSGIRAALGKHLQGVAWQRCRVHLKRELINRASWRDRRALAADLRAIYTSEDRSRCLSVAEEIAARWEERLPKMSQRLLAGVEETLTVLALPSELRRRLNSTNMLERQMREIRRRTRVVSIFPNEASCLRLIGACLLEVHESWLAEDRRYLNLDRRLG
jgi:putative transposase